MSRVIKKHNKKDERYLQSQQESESSRKVDSLQEMEKLQI